MSEPRWSRFVERPVQPGRKTRTWEVIPVSGELDVGTVAWDTRCRQYVFVPRLREEDNWMAYDVFAAGCLREIADFCEARTKEHKAAQAANEEG